MSGTTLFHAPDYGLAVEWSPEVGQRIIDAVNAGTALYKVAALPGMPSLVTIYEWREKHPEWAKALAHARAALGDRMAFDGLGKIDDCDGDSSSQVSKAREQAAYRRWLAGCLDRTTYGDAVQIDAKVQAVVSCFMSQAPRAAGEAAARDVLPVVVVRDVAEDEGAA